MDKKLNIPKIEKLANAINKCEHNKIPEFCQYCNKVQEIDLSDFRKYCKLYGLNKTNQDQDCCLCDMCQKDIEQYIISKLEEQKERLIKEIIKKNSYEN